MRVVFLILFTVMFVSIGVAQDVTFYKDIRPILCKHCVKCHQNDGAGPMPLETYEDAASFGAMIEYVVLNEIMPPWKANHSFSSLKEENYLSAAKAQIISDWVKGGVREGKKLDFTCQEKLIDTLESVDLIFSMEEKFIHKGDFKKSSQVFVFPFDNVNKAYVEGIQFIPGNKTIIRSCNVFIDTSGTAIALDNKTPAYGYANNGGVGFIPNGYIWHHWSPGQGAEVLVEGVKVIPANSTLLMHITYAPTYETSIDSSSLHIQLMKDTTDKEIIKSEILIDETSIINGNQLSIEPYARVFILAEKKIEKDIIILSAMPQGQYTCVSWSLMGIDSTGAVVGNILEVNNWDINWQRKYFLNEPLQLGPGSTIRAIARFNNSEENLNLPLLPPKKIVAGESRRAEMFRVQFDFYDKNKT